MLIKSEAKTRSEQNEPTTESATQLCAASQRHAMNTHIFQVTGRVVFFWWMGLLFEISHQTKCKNERKTATIKQAKCC